MVAPNPARDCRSRKSSHALIDPILLVEPALFLLPEPYSASYPAMAHTSRGLHRFFQTAGLRSSLSVAGCARAAAPECQLRAASSSAAVNASVGGAVRQQTVTRGEIAVLILSSQISEYY